MRTWLAQLPHSMAFGFVVLVTGVLAAAGLSPLFVTDYLPDRSQEAQKRSAVDLSEFGWKGENAMHSGFLALNPDKSRSTFFWYSESLDRNASAPLLLWLQGGPGASSLFGMFTEIGPFGINADGKLEPRTVTWNQYYHLLFLDNPVGTGFSFTESEDGFISSHEEAGKDLDNALSQFFELFPSLRSNDFYVTGESYAGKWVPSCAFTIHERNKARALEKRINLRGISIGDGAISPARQFQGFGDLLWNLGMADSNEREQFRSYEAKMQELLKQGQPVKAFEVFDEMLNGDFFPYPTYYANVTGMASNYFNFELAPDADPLGGDFVAWLNTAAVRTKIHVGDRKYAPANSTVEAYLKPDWMRDVIPMLTPLMDNYKVVIYSGQNDIILGPALTEQFLLDMPWGKQAEYRKAPKTVWRRADKGPGGSKLADVAGYARQVGQFWQVVVRGAGHMVPGDQPERALDLITRFVEGRSFGESKQLSAGAAFVV